MTNNFAADAASFAQTETVNHFVAAKVGGKVVAIFNNKSGSVQVFDETVFATTFPAHAFGAKRVRVTKSNDARVMFV